MLRRSQLQWRHDRRHGCGAARGLRENQRGLTVASRARASQTKAPCKCDAALQKKAARVLRAARFFCDR